MATRANVGYKNPDGSINGSYVHYDGYLDGVGVALHLSHNDNASAKKLGYADGIRGIEVDQAVETYNDGGTKNQRFDSEDEYHDYVVKGYEYGYLYDPSRGWLFTGDKYGTNEFIELEDQLMYDELLPGSGDSPELEEYNDDDRYELDGSSVGDGKYEDEESELQKEVEVGVVDTTQDEEEMGLEEGDVDESFDSLAKKLDKQKGIDKGEAAKIAGSIAAKKMKGAGKGPTAKQKARADESIHDSMRGNTLKEHFNRFLK